MRDRTGLVDEVLVIDSGSVDNTAKVAAEAGASVHHRDEILPGYGTQPGKGDVLWKALAVATGDIICYVDADLTDFRATFVTGLLGPLLTDPTVGLVKAFYDRPLLDRHRPAAAGSPNSQRDRCSARTSPSWPASYNRSPASTPAGARSWPRCRSHRGTASRRVC